MSNVQFLVLVNLPPGRSHAGGISSRHGRRRYPMVHTILLPAAPGLEDVVEERKTKYMEWLEGDEEDSGSEDESSSDE